MPTTGSIPAGAAVGPYEVVSLLGAGGMGEVYRARDTRLDRAVALKVVRSSLVSDSNLRARFEREARAISQLSHPNICALYDVGHENGCEYLVMELVEGETLADRIARGPLPQSQVLRFGAQIADALHHAHRSGIAHRDLKPGNVMLTSSGVKLLDFGLAKSIQRHVFSDASAPATVQPLTAEGTIVGTMQYMSPEQLHGAGVDHRSDLFSLGLVLYEMASGKRPFPATSSAGLIAAIVSGDPVPLRSIQPSVSPALERIILTALEKNPDDRWQDAHDLARQLRWLAESSQSSAEGAAIPLPAARRFTPAVAAALAAVAAIGLTAGGMRFLAQPQTPSLPVRLQFVPPADIPVVTSPESPNFAISPDGRTLCYVGRQGRSRWLFVRALDSVAVRKIEETENPFGPFWSPDGKWIGYSANGKLWKIPATGGVPQPLCDVSAGGAIGSWATSSILFVDRSGGRIEIYRVADTGGASSKVTTLAAGEWRHGWPRALPDGKHFLFLASKSRSLERQVVLSTFDGQRKSVLLTNVSHVDLVEDDRLAYVRDGKLLTQRFDADRGSVEGEPLLVASDVAYFYLSGRAHFSAAGGTIVYRTDTTTGSLSLASRDGSTRALDEGFPFYDARISPDGRRAVVTVTDRATGMGDLWIYDLARGVKDRFTNEPGFELTGLWTRDGRSIVYTDAPGGSLPHLVRRTLGNGGVEPVLPPGKFQFASSFTADGTSLYFSSLRDETREDILRLDLSTNEVTPVVATKFNETNGQVSPDGKWLAFVSDVAGPAEVYLQRLDEPNAARTRVSQGGGASPRWRGDGRELVYLAEGGIVMSVTSKAGDWSDISTTELLRATKSTLVIDVSPDGQHILLVDSARGASDSSFQVVVPGGR